jgi:hypothetical protein
MSGGRVNHYVLVTGGRDADDVVLQEVDDCLTFLHHFYGARLRVMHGAARGVDTKAQEVCERLGIVVKAFPADWGRGKRAGIERNEKMGGLLIKWMAQGHSGEVLAFRGGRGTEHMATFAGQLGIDVTRIPTTDPAWT